MLAVLELDVARILTRLCCNAIPFSANTPASRAEDHRCEAGQGGHFSFALYESRIAIWPCASTSVQFRVGGSNFFNRPFGWSSRQAIFFWNRKTHSENRAKPMAVSITRCCQKSARLAPRRITARASSMKYVVGNRAPTAQKI